MSKFLLVAVLSFGLTAFSGFENPETYAQTIQIPANASPDVKATAADLAFWLKRATGREYKVNSGAEKATSGIILTKTPPASLPADKAKSLDKASRESFWLFSKNKDALWIVGNSDDALAHGVYTYLYKLGFRWFMPGESWAYWPENLRDLTLQLDEVTEPFYKQRWFSGTGGFIDNPAIDPENVAEEEWAIWQKRNRFGREHIFGGHVGEGFNLHNKKELEAHPEYLAEVKGERKWTRTAKICMSNADARKLFVEDRLKDFRAKMRKSGKDPKNMLVSVEPADADGHCECLSCKKMGTVSDRVFLLANEVQEALKKENPKAQVNLFAYNDHAAVPSVKINNGVQVGIAPFVFQRFGSAEVLTRDWAAKMPEFFVRDYWGIAIWQKELPGWGPGQLIKRFDYWRQFRSFRGVIAQSSYSKGAVGPTLFLASRLLWNPDENPDAAMGEFFEKMFGPAAPPMKRMLERWDANYTEAFDLPLAFADVEEAMSLARDAATRERITDYMAYLNYLYLYFDTTGGKKKVAGNNEEKAEALINYIWGIHDRLVLHTSRIHSILINKLIEDDSSLKEKWGLKGKRFKADTWKDVKKLSSAEVVQLFKQYKKAASAQFGIEGMAEANQQLAQRRSQNAPTDDARNGSFLQKEAIFNLSKTHDATLFSAKQKSLTLLARRTGKADEAAIFYLTLLDEKGKIVFAQDFSDIGETSKSIKLPLAPGQKHRLNIRVKGTSIELKVSNDVDWAFEEMLDLEGGTATRFFFEVQKGQSHAILRLEGARSTLNIYDPEGKAFEATPDERGIISFRVPAEKQGKKWMFSCPTGGTVRVLTLPNQISAF